MWSAQFVSNIGSWVQMVAAQWLMLTLTASATYVALVQTAASLPVVLLAVLAGTVGHLLTTYPSYAAASCRSRLAAEHNQNRTAGGSRDATSSVDFENSIPMQHDLICINGADH